MEGVTCSGCQGELAEYFVFAFVEEALETVGKLPVSEIVWFPICQRFTARSSRFRGLCAGASAPNTPYRLFRGRPVYSNSIFVDGVCSALFPQMDVWLRCQSVGPAKRSRTVRDSNHLLARGTHSAESRESPFPLDFYLSWMPPKPPQPETMGDDSYRGIFRPSPKRARNSPSAHLWPPQPPNRSR
jgi:hypothetical protein